MKEQGFSLIELLITIAIMAILAVVAFPSYQNHVTKTRRADAMSLLLQNAGFMERFYTEKGCYRNRGADNICGSADDTNPTLPFARSPAEGSKVFYAITLDAASGSNGGTFLLTADPSGTPQAGDGVLTLNNRGEHGWSKNPSGNTSSWQ